MVDIAVASIIADGMEFSSWEKEKLRDSPVCAAVIGVREDIIALICTYNFSDRGRNVSKVYAEEEDAAERAGGLEGNIQIRGDYEDRGRGIWYGPRDRERCAPLIPRVPGEIWRTASSWLSTDLLMEGINAGQR
jgi:hypothetical protein